MFRSNLRYLSALLLLLLLTRTARAQETRYYPDIIYPGDNIITISDPNGIETISFTASPHTRVEVPAIRGCPKKINVGIHVDDATTDESVDFRVNNCRGEFSTKTLGAENWSMRQERMPVAVVGRDTCLQFNLTTSHQTIIDSIYVDNPDMYVKMPPQQDGMWQARSDAVFHYYICYQPKRAERTSATLSLKIRRDYPNEGLTHYVVDRSILAASVLPAPPKPRDTSAAAMLPAVTDPTTFQNIIMPTAESIGDKKFFVADYDLAGVLMGYGFTDRFSVFAGGAFVPEAISKLIAVVTVAKYEVYSASPLNAALGGLFAYTSSKTSDIATEALFGVVSLGDKRRRFSVAGGYSWKHHKTAGDAFNRNAIVITFGGDLTIARGWKLAAEGYYIESSGIAPAAVTAKYFTDRFALAFGFGINFSGSSDVSSTSALTGDIKSLPFAPIISATWVW